MSKKNYHGSDFRDFLDQQGILGEVEARTLKQSLSLQLDRPETLTEGVRRIEDVATGRIKGLTEGQFRTRLRRKAAPR
jgi:hypothetical protein